MLQRSSEMSLEDCPLIERSHIRWTRYLQEAVAIPNRETIELADTGRLNNVANDMHAHFGVLDWYSRFFQMNRLSESSA
jgi:hypothetical protein